MFNGNKNNKAESKFGGGEEHKDCKEDKMLNDNAGDLYKRYIHDIRNMKPLDKGMINNIRNMSNEDKMNIIILFNDVLEYINCMLK
jgi:hypothetical protein